MTGAERFWSMVQKSDGCWLWTGSKCGWNQAYGTIFFRGKQRRAHRVSWELAYGVSPENLFVCHHCDTPSCVRPDHLFLGTQSDNMKDCARKGRMGAWTKPESLARGKRQGTHTHPEKRPYGEHHGMHKLTIKDAVEIIRLRGKIPQWKIAKQFGITQTHVSAIQRGENWSEALRAYDAACGEEEKK